jgi:hypothetical protein
MVSSGISVSINPWCPPSVKQEIGDGCAQQADPKRGAHRSIHAHEAVRAFEYVAAGPPAPPVHSVKNGRSEFGASLGRAARRGVA